MTYVITEPCIGVKDASCVDVCPVNAIFFEDDTPNQWKSYVDINADWFKTHDVGTGFRARTERH